MTAACTRRRCGRCWSGAAEFIIKHPASLGGLLQMLLIRLETFIEIAHEDSPLS